MFNLKNKISSDLKLCITEGLYKKYRVIIKCSSLLESVVKKITRSKNDVLRIMPEIKCIIAILSPRFIERLIEYPEISYITLDSLATSLPITSEVITNKDTNLFVRPIDISNELQLNGKGITVALLSTGIYPNKDLISPENRIISSIDLTNSYSRPYDDNGMGTYLSGIIGGNGVSSNSLIKGIAPRCSFYSIKAFNALGRGFIGDILYGLQLIIDNAKEFNIHVLVLPFETLSFNSFSMKLFQKFFDEITKLGISILIPSGSNGDNCNALVGIASLNNIITVGGLNSLRPPRLYGYSSICRCNKKDKPDFLSLCCNLYTLNLNRKFIPERNGKATYPSYLSNNYCKITCISAACAYYAGICALLYEHSTDFSLKDIFSLLNLSSTHMDFDSKNVTYPMVYLKNLILPTIHKEKP